ncbi:MAG: probable rRNA maturation factor [Candidatus Kentron sp. G]|nr:MAG: probable rRNA maturation factor [Candidatus Kentron sp. G]VFN04200.1 MAG: probable rRNA maturation factor [Candidatus Kentron sp. G]VFN05278.1 MAG: probable rRNA maturation factor [Candidatus Kentron sp. G]
MELQYASTETGLPTYEDIYAWIDTTFNVLNRQGPRIPPRETGPHPGPNHRDSDIELTVRIVDEEEIVHLNGRYRGREGPTNVLSFPYRISDLPGVNLLGDIVVCASVVKREAGVQHKELHGHWAHMIVHGTLHLLGFDHLSEAQGAQMESLETVVLAHLGFSDPY